MSSNWIGPVIGTIGIAFAWYQYRQRVKMEAVVRDALRRLAGDMWVVFANANWSNQHLRSVGHKFIEANPDLKQIRLETFDAARDAAACARQLSFAHSKIQWLQQSLFKDSVEILPKILSDDVQAARAILEAAQKADEKKPETKTEAICSTAA